MSSTGIRMLPVGDAAVLVELTDLDQTLQLFDLLGHDPLPGVTEVVPAARTLLVRFDPRATSIAQIQEQLAQRDLGGTRAAREPPGELIEIPVVYDGADLAEVAQVTALTPAEVVRRHGAHEYTVAFTGFAPGFAYLVGGDPRLRVPRRSTARTSIPAGSVGLASEFSGVYPRRSPGGWQLIGRTETSMWDESRDEPALLRPGMRVRFVEVLAGDSAAAVPEKLRPEAPAPTPGLLPAAPAVPAAAAAPALEIIDAGLLLTLQDDGRPGNAIRGVSPSGAMDHASLHRANRGVGNRPGAAAFEFAGAPIILSALVPLTLATSGAIGEVIITHPDRAERLRLVTPGTVFAAEPGDEIELVPDAAAGRYGYLAVRGGLAGTRVLGSVATDTLSSLGTPRPTAGDLFEISDEAIGTTQTEIAPPLPDVGSVTEIPIVLGPRDGNFTPAGRAALLDQDWQVTASSDRVGIRLHGQKALERETGDELPSEGTIAGAIQVPPNGQPVVFMADHPVTGGYPVVAVVARDALDTIAQIPAGARIRFRVRASAL